MLAWRNVVVSAAVLGFLGCEGAGCQELQGLVTPLQAPIPPEEIIEGAVQVRVSRAGFDKLSEAIPPVVRAALANGVCVPPTTLSDQTLTGAARICQDDGCPGNQPGCLATAAVERITFDVPDGGPFGVDVTLDLDIPLQVEYDAPLLPAVGCTLGVTADDLRVTVRLAFGTATDGTLSFRLEDIDLVDLPLGFSGCSVLGPTLDLLYPLLRSFLESALGNGLVDLLTPVLDGFVQGFLPRPLGIVGEIDVGKILSLFLPGARARLELSGIPGGHVQLQGGGLSLGLMIGVGSDADPTTRAAGASGPGTFHEHARCVPDIPFVPPSLPRHPARNTFVLAQVPELSGMPEADGDFLIGVSEQLMDLVGFHVVNSGTLCVGVGSAQVPLLTVGTLGIVLPSLQRLADDPGAPLLMLLRPQRTVDLSIGTGATDPATGDVVDPTIKMDLQQLEIDFYAYVLDGYERAFTMVLDIRAGLNVEFMTTADGKPAVLPVLSEISSENLRIGLDNEELLAESREALEMLFPMLVDIIVPAVGGFLQPFPLPDVGGYSLSGLALRRLETPEEIFLAVSASLGAVGGMPKPEPARARTVVASADVRLPDRATLQRAALLPPGHPGRDGLPSVTLALGPDAAGRPLEHQWRVDGGMWRAFARGDRLVIRDAALLLEGEHAIEVRARVQGDYRTLDLEGAVVPVRVELPEHGFHGRAPAGEDGCQGCAVGGGRGRQVPLALPVLVLLAAGALRRRALAGLLLLPLVEACSDGTPAGTACLDDSQCRSEPCSGTAIPLCVEGACACADDIPLGQVGRYAAVAAEGGMALVAAYNETYGDLCVGTVAPPGRVERWQFVDGVPPAAPVVPGSSIRHGIRALGDDVGRWAAITVGPDGVPRLAAYDATNRGLRYVARGPGNAQVWSGHTVEAGPAPLNEGEGDDVGLWPAIALLADGRPAIAYFAARQAAGQRLGELHLAIATGREPRAAADWKVAVVDGIALPAMPAKGDPLPDATGLTPALTQLPGGDLAIAYYDRRQGNLMLARYTSAGDPVGLPEILDGAHMGRDTGDVGLGPAIALGADGALHVLYQDATNDAVRYVNTRERAIEVVDDGFRVDGKNADGLDEPVRHLVGEQAVLFDVPGGLWAIYQDSTSHEIVSAVRAATGGGAAGPWQLGPKVAPSATGPGHEEDRAAYGFYTRGVLVGEEAWVATYAVDQRAGTSWVEVFTHAVSIR